MNIDSPVEIAAPMIGQDYFASREKAEEFKRISDRAYGKLLGEGQTRITTEIIER